MFDGPIKGFMAMLPKLPWFALVFIVAGTLHLLITSGGFTLDFYIKGVLTSVLAAATTALVFGSADAT